MYTHINTHTHTRITNMAVNAYPTKAECDIKGYIEFLAIYSNGYQGTNILMDAHVEWNKLVAGYPSLNGIKLVKKYTPKRAPSAYNMFISLYMRTHKPNMGFKHANIVWKALKFDNPTAKSDGQTLFNIFKNELEAAKLKKELEEKSAKMIQSSWHRAISNPKYKVCRDRLLNEFNNM